MSVLLVTLTMTLAKSRRTPRRQPQTETAEENQPMDQENSNDDQLKVTETTLSSKKDNTAAKSRSKAKQKTREVLRSKNMGLGIKINTTETVTSKKITFNDEILEALKKEPLEDVKGKEEDEEEENDSESSDEDMEEIKGSSAREKALGQRSTERENAKVKNLERKYRKKKTKPIDTMKGSDDDFNEEFFEQLDNELATRRLEKKKLTINEPKGKRIAFVSADDEVRETIQTDYNIELVVIGNDSAMAKSVDAKLGTAPSEAAIIFSRSKLMHGKDLNFVRSKTKQKKRATVTIGWTRSKKMNRIMYSNKRNAAHGQPAVHFVVNA